MIEKGEEGKREIKEEEGEGEGKGEKEEERESYNLKRMEIFG